MDEMPVFVKIDEYKDVLEVMNLIKGKMEDARQTLNKIQQLKSEEDAELESWQHSLEDVESKIDFIDRELFEPEMVR